MCIETRSLDNASQAALKSPADASDMASDSDEAGSEPEYAQLSDGPAEEDPEYVADNEAMEKMPPLLDSNAMSFEVASVALPETISIKDDDSEAVKNIPGTLFIQTDHPESHHLTLSPQRSETHQTNGQGPVLSPHTLKSLQAGEDSPRKSSSSDVLHARADSDTLPQMPSTPSQIVRDDSHSDFHTPAPISSPMPPHRQQKTADSPLPPIPKDPYEDGGDEPSGWATIRKS